MGAFDEVPNIVLPNPDDPEASASFRKKWRWEPHEQVTLRGSYTTADQEAVENAATAFAGKGKGTQVDSRMGSARRALMTRMIVSWTFMYRGQSMPVNADSISRLPINYRTPILDKCDEIAENNVLSEEEQEDFLDSANEHAVIDSTLVNPSPTN